MNYVHIYHDEQGETHFADRELEMTERLVAPPADPAVVSQDLPVEHMNVMRLRPGWYGTWHPSPGRIWMLVLAGSSLVEVSDGERRSTQAGDVYLCTDSVGKGHLSMNAGDSDLVIAIVTISGAELPREPSIDVKETP